MAEAMLTKSTLRLIFDHGFNDKGKAVTKTKAFTNISKTAGPDNMRAAAQAIAAISEKPLAAVERNDVLEIN